MILTESEIEQSALDLLKELDGYQKAYGPQMVDINSKPPVGAGSEPARTPIYYAWLEPAPTATCYAWLEPASTPAYAFVRCANKTLPSIWADHVGAGSEPARTPMNYAWLEPARTPIYYAWLEPAPTATCYAWLEPASTPAYAFVRCANKTLPSIWADHVGAGSEPARTPMNYAWLEPARTPIYYAWLEPARTPTHTPTQTPANGRRNYVPK